MGKLFEYIKADCFRYGIKNVSLSKLLYIYVINPVPGLKFLVIFRCVQHYRRKSRLLFYFFYIWLRHLKVKYGIDISYRTLIGKGCYIGHFGGITIHGDVIIGDNCNISQGVTIGVSNSPKNTGCPTIGNSVFIGPGACIFGNILIGNNSIIGANCVISEDITESVTVVAGRPIVLNMQKSEYYIQNKIL